MSSILRICVAASLALLVASPSWAASSSASVKHGLWSVTVDTTVADMPPGAPGVFTQTVEHCITKDDELVPDDPNQSKDSCTKSVTTSGNKIGYEFKCKDGSEGTGEFTFAKDSYSGLMNMKFVDSGKTRKAKSKIHGVYKGACPAGKKQGVSRQDIPVPAGVDPVEFDKALKKMYGN